MVQHNYTIYTMYKLYHPLKDTLDILYCDQHLVAINKPPGLLTHKSAIDKYEQFFAVQMLRDQLNQWVYPLHRLDKPTSGILLFALSSEIAHQIQKQFIAHTIQKQYTALVRGFTLQDQSINHPVNAIATFKRNKIKQDASTQQPIKEAHTLLSTLKKFELPINVDRYPCSRYSLVSLSPITGHRHQLRYHMKHIAHPIIGDKKYGKSIHNNFFINKFSTENLLLCATKLSFTHPVSNERICLEAPLFKDFETLLLTLQPFELFS
jgi:tRNA pseudouridine65 synthase